MGSNPAWSNTLFDRGERHAKIGKLEGRGAEDEKERGRRRKRRVNRGGRGEEAEKIGALQNCSAATKGKAITN